MPAARLARHAVPVFSLYGESSGLAPTDALHIEDIQSRSRKYLWKIGTHRHSGLCQCVYVASGPMSVDLDDSRLETAGPAVVVVPSGIVHGFRFRADSEGYVLTLNLDRLSSFATAAHLSVIVSLFSIPRAIPLTEDRLLAMRLEHLLSALLQESRQPDSMAAPIGGWLACSALWILASTVSSSTAVGPTARRDLERLRRFRMLVETHYLQHWPVHRYTRRLALSDSSLNRLCARLTGVTAFDLIQQRLALEARRRLIYVSDSVASVAAELGFKDPAYFCRFFRKHNGVSPAAFRRRHGGDPR